MIGKQVELVHSVINFEPVLRKIKIDKYLKRKASKKTHTKYLQIVSNTPNKVVVNTLLVAELMYLQSKGHEIDFYGTSTAQKIIDS